MNTSVCLSVCHNCDKLVCNKFGWNLAGRLWLGWLQGKSQMLTYGEYTEGIQYIMEMYHIFVYEYSRLYLVTLIFNYQSSAVAPLWEHF